MQIWSHEQINALFLRMDKTLNMLPRIYDKSITHANLILGLGMDHLVTWNDTQ